MAHHIYTTKGLVLAMLSSREVDRVFTIFTEELGLVTAIARGARKISSKLSSNLPELSLVKVSLVRGRHSWRITTASLLSDTASLLREKRKALQAISRIFALLRRLVHGEEGNIELYRDLEKAMHLVLTDVDEEDLDAWELLTVAKILFHLGYLSKEALPANIIETREKRRAILQMVNSGIKESGLQ